MVCSFFRLFCGKLQRWFRDLSSRLGPRSRLAGGVQLTLQEQIHFARQRFETWKKNENPYRWDNYGFKVKPTIENQSFDGNTIVMYSDGSHFPQLSTAEIDEIKERGARIRNQREEYLRSSKYARGGDRKKEKDKFVDQLNTFSEQLARQGRASIGVYMGESHPLELGFRIGPLKNSFKTECVAIAVALHRLLCWPKYKCEKVILRTDCLWAITILKHWELGSLGNPVLKTKEGTTYALDGEDMNNLKYVRYVASQFPKDVVLQFVPSHTKSNLDPALDRADRLAKNANINGPTKPSQNDKNEMKWDKSKHEHIIQVDPTMWESIQKEKPRKRSEKLIESSKMDTEITKLLRDKENELIGTIYPDSFN